MIDYASFYQGAFGSNSDVRAFVECLARPEERCRAKIVLYQGARMVWLADRIWEDVAKGRDPLQILFYIISAEATAKLVADFKSEGQSRVHVRQFFERICSDQHREKLNTAFANEIGEPFPARHTIDLLYNVRCDVAHKAKYYEFALPNGDGDTPLINNVEGHGVEARITREELRQIIVEGTILGAARIVPESHKCHQFISDEWGSV